MMISANGLAYLMGIQGWLTEESDAASPSDSWGLITRGSESAHSRLISQVFAAVLLGLLGLQRNVIQQGRPRAEGHSIYVDSLGNAGWRLTSDAVDS